MFDPNKIKVDPRAMDNNREESREMISCLFNNRENIEYDVLYRFGKSLHKLLCLGIAKHISNYGYLKINELDIEFGEGLYEYLIIDHGCIIRELEDGNLIFIIPPTLRLDDVFVSTYGKSKEDLLSMYEDYGSIIRNTILKNDVNVTLHDGVVKSPKYFETTHNQREAMRLPILSKELEDMEQLIWI